jgi:hypothetical protein
MKDDLHKILINVSDAMNKSWNESRKRAEGMWTQSSRTAGVLWSKTEKAATDACDWTQENAEAAWKSFKATGAEFRDYIESDAFESDLDDLACRLKVKDTVFLSQSESDRWKRVHKKIEAIKRHSKDDVTYAMELGATLGAATFNPKVILALSFLFGGAKGAVIAYHCYHAFVARKAPQGDPVTN